MVDAFVSFAIENLANLVTDEVKLLIGDKEEVDKLSKTFTAIQASLDDAEMRQFKNDAVEEWMTELKYMEYDVLDMLDELKVKSHQLGTNNGGSCNSVWNFFTHYCICFKQLVLRYNICKRMKRIDKKLDQIAKDRGRFNYQENRKEFGAGNSRETSSHVDTVFGREDDKSKIKNKLISEGSSEPSDDIPVVSIVGMAGCGKTTFAQLVFNEPEVKSHFQQLIWVCVSTEFDVAKIVKMILGAILKKTPPSLELDPLSELLRETLQNKRFLLVLDDVWNEDYAKWRDLENILRKCGVNGSKIVVTTRSEKVALVMGPYMHKLDTLSDELCWSIFRGIAFEGRDQPSTLIDIGKQIVAKCKGLPLAVKTIAGALRCAKTHTDWENALNAEIWEKPEVGVIPALLLSYYHLSPPLKRCFRYCSLFPKDSKLKKEELVEMWVAQDYIRPQRKRKREIEDVGREYFEELLELSLFQEPERDEWGNITGCKMHDLVHDLAQFVTNGEFVSNDNPMINIKNVRHCTFESNESHSFAFESLRSFVAAYIDVCDIIQQLRCVRVLKFSTRNNLESLKSLGRLVHLRYLDLSGSEIEALPESVMTLWNLRYLNLEETSLKQIPESVGKLGQLRHINLSWSEIKELPESIAGLRHLQVLDVSLCEKLCQLPESVGKLGQLKHINLSRTEIKELPESIADLPHLQVLDVSGCSKLCKLPSEIKKMTSLKQLRIEDTPVLRTFPAGIGRLTSLERLERFILTEGQCNHSELRHLNRIRGSLRIENLWLGSREEAVNAKLEDKTFLQGLELSWLRNEEPSSPREEQEELSSFSEEQEELSSFREELSSFREEEEEASRAEGVLEALRPPPTLQNLKIVGYPGLKFPGWVGEPTFNGLRTLRIEECDNLRSLPEEFMRSLSMGLQELSISFCPLLEDVSWKMGVHMPYLRKLEIYNCDNLEVFPLIVSEALKEVVIWRCPTLRSLPKEFMRSLKGLQELCICDCPLLEDVSWKMGVQMPCLRMLEIEDCGNLKVFPLIVSEALKEVVIAGCPNLTDVASIPSGVEKLQLPAAKMLSTLPDLPMLNYLMIRSDDDVIEVPHDLIRLTELQTLHIYFCSNLRSLPEEMSSLKKLRELVIYYSPNLRESCKIGGEQWSKIAHIPRIKIDDEIIQDHK